MAVFETLVEDEAAGLEILGQRVELARQAVEFLGAEDANLLQPLRMRAAGLDVEREELAVEDHVLAGEEVLDARVDLDAGFLPEEIGHGVGSLKSGENGRNEWRGNRNE